MRAVVVTCFGDNPCHYQDGLASAGTYRHLNPDHEVYMTFDEERCPRAYEELFLGEKPPGDPIG